MTLWEGWGLTPKWRSGRERLKPFIIAIHLRMNEKFLSQPVQLCSSVRLSGFIGPTLCIWNKLNALVVLVTSMIDWHGPGPSCFSRSHMVWDVNKRGGFCENVKLHFCSYHHLSRCNTLNSKRKSTLRYLTSTQKKWSLYIQNCLGTPKIHLRSVSFWVLDKSKSVYFLLELSVQEFNSVCKWIWLLIFGSKCLYSYSPVPLVYTSKRRIPVQVLPPPMRIPHPIVVCSCMYAFLWKWA